MHYVCKGCRSTRQWCSAPRWAVGARKEAGACGLAVLAFVEVQYQAGPYPLEQHGAAQEAAHAWHHAVRR